MFANSAINRRARTRFYERQMKKGRVQNPCTTRGVSFTNFPKNTLGKDVLDRCGRPPKLDNSVEAFDESAEFFAYRRMMQDNEGVL